MDDLDRLEDINRLTPPIMEWFEGVYPSLKTNINHFSSNDWEKSKEFSKLLIENKINTVEGFTVTQAINGLNILRNADLTLAREREIMDMILRYFIK